MGGILSKGRGEKQSLLPSAPVFSEDDHISNSVSEVADSDFRSEIEAPLDNAISGESDKEIINLIDDYIWNKSKFKIFLYVFYCFVAAIPTALLILFDRKNIFPSRLKNWGDFISEWNKSGNSVKAIADSINAMLIDCFFNMRFFYPALVKMIALFKNFKQLNYFERRNAVGSVVGATASALAFGAIGYTLLEFSPAVSFPFFFLNFSVYFSPRFLSIFNTVEIFYDKNKQLKSHFSNLLRELPNQKLLEANLEADENPNSNEDLKLEKYYEKAVEVYTMEDRSSRQYCKLLKAGKIIDFFGMLILIYPVLPVFSQKSLKGMNVLIGETFKNDKSYYISPWLLLGYILGVPTTIFYLKTFYKFREHCTDYLLTVYRRRNSSGKIMTLFYAASFVILAPMCVFASGGLRNMLNDLLDQEYLDYWPLLKGEAELWRIIAYAVGSIIKFDAVITLLLNKMYRHSSTDETMTPQTLRQILDYKQDYTPSTLLPVCLNQRFSMWGSLKKYFTSRCFQQERKNLEKSATTM